MEISHRKKEISNIFIAISKIEEIEEKELVASYSFPRLYGHYEKFIEEQFSRLINTILQDDQLKLTELNKKIMYYLLFINFKEMGENKFLKKYTNINETWSIKELEKEKIKSYIKNTNIGKNFMNLANIFDFKTDEIENKLDALKLKISLLSKKYEARNHIAHGHLEYHSLTFEEFETLKNMVEESLELIDTIFNIYLSKNLYLCK